jgi:hypothetical protein
MSDRRRYDLPAGHDAASDREGGLTMPPEIDEKKRLEAERDLQAAGLTYSHVFERMQHWHAQAKSRERRLRDVERKLSEAEAELRQLNGERLVDRAIHVGAVQLHERDEWLRKYDENPKAVMDELAYSGADAPMLVDKTFFGEDPPTVADVERSDVARRLGVDPGDVL